MGRILDDDIVETGPFEAAREIDKEIRLQPVHGGIAGPLVPPCLRAEAARDEPGEVKLLWHGLSFRRARPDERGDEPTRGTSKRHANQSGEAIFCKARNGVKKYPGRRATTQHPSSM